MISYDEKYYLHTTFFINTEHIFKNERTYIEQRENIYSRMREDILNKERRRFLYPIYINKNQFKERDYFSIKEDNN